VGTYEMRIDRLGFNVEKNYDNIQSFSIGHESCIIKFFKVIQQKNLLDFVKKQKKAGREIRVITPFVPEKHLDEMKEVIKRICKEECFQDSVIIVNDFGLMSYINRIDEDRKMCLGRSLLFCLDYAPWGHKIYENEPEQIQKVVSQISFYDDEKMEFYREYHVSEIEVNLTAGTIESLKEIQRAGFKVNVHNASFLYGTQRSCYIRRCSPEQNCCGTECEYAEELELDELWEAAGYYKKADDINFPNPLYLRGNQIYGKAYDIPCDYFDGIIVNAE
jgi:hypothetical protein